MNIIKLNAINSTNDYLKEMCKDIDVQNFTVVTAEAQTQGRGQRGAHWISEPGKNLTFSVLIKSVLMPLEHIFTLNITIAVSIIETLQAYKIQKLAIKWPNDILAGNKKIGGVLIENTVKNQIAVNSVIGIGLNINQQNFDGMANAGSLLSVSGQEYNKEDIMLNVVNNLKQNINNIQRNNASDLWSKYHSYLFKKEIPTTFENTSNQKFMGIIKGVTKNGRLQVQLEDDSIACYNIKEIKMLY